MKIIKYEKIKNNQYKLYLDDSSTINLYDDIILNNNLLITKEINNLEDIIKANSFYDCYYIGIKYLNKKMRTKKELYNYLIKKYSNDVVNKTIIKINNEGYLNDDIYASAYINDQIKLSNKGYNKILIELTTLEIKEEISIKYLNNISKDIWFERINKLVDKKIKINKKNSVSILKEKITYDLVNLGYNKNDILDILNNKEFNDHEALNKEFNIEYSKLSRKYNGKELELKIITKMMSKGFNYNDIKDLLKKMQQKKNE